MSHSPAMIAVPERRWRMNWRIAIFAAAVFVLVGVPAYVYLDEVLSGGVKQRTDAKGELVEINLQAMSLFPFDQANGQLEDVPPKWRQYDGRRVLLIGEIWAPDSASPRISAFSLVYSIARCCVGPQQQVQHFVHCRVPAKGKVPYYGGLVRVVGKLAVNVVREGERVVSVYQLEVERVEPVR